MTITASMMISALICAVAWAIGTYAISAKSAGGAMALMALSVMVAFAGGMFIGGISL